MLFRSSSDTGLEWAWDAVHHSPTTTNLGNFSIQVNRALSRANAVIVKTRPLTAVSTSLLGQIQNSYASEPWLDPVLSNTSLLNQGIDGRVTSFQVQLGAQYIPAAAIQHPTQFLHSALKTFAQFRRNDEVGGVPLSLFTGVSLSRAPFPVPPAAIDDTKQDETLPGLAIAAVPLESSSTLQQSGAAISAQRTAVVNVTYAHGRASTPDSPLRKIDLFIPYTKLATLFLDSVVVRS